MTPQEDGRGRARRRARKKRGTWRLLALAALWGFSLALGYALGSWLFS